MGVSHDALVKRGASWLRKKKCALILTEMVGGASESPDVFGVYANGTTILVECKATRSDFRADCKKITRIHPYMGIGRERYYLTPKGLLDPDELPSGWGLLEFTGKRVVCRKPSCTHEYNEVAEKAVLVSMVRRLKIEPGRHVSLIVTSPYSLQTKCRATLSITEEE